MFIFNSFQNIILLFVFNLRSKHRKYFYSNKSYLFYVTLLTFVTIDMITSLIPNYLSFTNSLLFTAENLKKIHFLENEFNRVILITFIIANGIITYGIEFLVEWLMPDKKQN